MEVLISHLDSLKIESPSLSLKDTSHLRSLNIEPNPLLDLPVELKLQILSNLRVKEIVCSRQVSRHFRNLVDTKSNVILLTRPIETRERSRLQRSGDRYIEYSAETPFLEALSRVFEHRGFWLWQLTYRDELLTFAAHWLHNCRGIPQPSSYFQSSLHVTTGRLARQMTKVHAYHHFPLCTDQASVEKQDIFLSKTRALGAQLGFDEAALTTAYEQLRRGQGVLQGRLRSKYKDDKAGEGIPSWPLTALFSRSQAREQFGQKIDSICSIAQLVEMLGVPPFSDLQHFAVCAETEWACERVKEAVNGTILEPLVKAAVLEDLWIF